jgi:type II restriction/modification system DNA methylase subunit YeeA
VSHPRPIGEPSKGRLLTPQQFAAKWTTSTLKERSAAQEHFLDLCHMLGESTPAEVDPHGDWYCFERGAKKTGGGDGWADVWRKGYFAWEYKGKHKDLNVAFAQLQRYAIALENPPLLVVSDMASIEIHTNFTNTVHEIHIIPVVEIGTANNLQLLKRLFSDPDALKPGQTKAALTEEAARRFALLAQVLRDRGGEPERVAHFLNRILFCLFAQDAKLLPANIINEVLETGLKRPEQSNQMLKSLFAAMKKGGVFGAHIIAWFNGSLFDSNDAIPLVEEDTKEILSVARLNWSAIEPSIFGTLFERGLDPAKRAQIGAHYTDAHSIMRIVDPTIVNPLTAKWERAKLEINAILNRAEEKGGRPASIRAQRQAQQTFNAFLQGLAEFRVLDPACGSGNFLYIALQALKDLEHRATLEAEQLGLEPPLTGMHVGVKCLRGIELNTYAAELARVTVWIGEIQWMLRHGMQPSRDPILKPLETIECRDAIVGPSRDDPKWPDVDVIIGNPPFLGNKRMLSELGDSYTGNLRRLFKGRIPGGVDLVTYWFERAREHIKDGRAARAGFVATQSIRKGTNRIVLDRIVDTVPIFDAWRDEAWINNGAAVRVSIVSFGRGSEASRLDGDLVPDVNADLTPRGTGPSIMQAGPQLGNAHIAFQGPVKVGSFDIPGEVARAWLKSPNAHRRPNSDVLRPWANGRDITGRPSDTWIIDFGTSMSQAQAALYEKPFQHVLKRVKPAREAQRDIGRKTRWWLHGRTGEDFRKALAPIKRYLVTSRVSKHRFFVWLPATVWPDSRLFAICRDDDFTFGVLSSRIHLTWALAQASRHGVGNDPTYNAHDCFETFPFPTPDGETRSAVELAARRLDELREQWLNPTEWVKRQPEVVSSFPDRSVPRPDFEAELKCRTMTNLYNEYPQWLSEAHTILDLAVARAYGWRDFTIEMPTAAIISRLLALNLSQPSELFAQSEGKARPAEVPANGVNGPAPADRAVKRRGVKNHPTTQGDMFSDASARRSSNVTPLASFPPGDTIRKPPIRASRPLVKKQHNKGRKG